ncbi:MAG: nicotinate-nucleotide adenylyltransferase [Candidatus Rokubacteria bacterium]|nr:nicotinate-nucleotide adenylyltransferase [Candidatus Rokubacteria bacterium]
MPEIGVLGGSFNPIHFGHLLVADLLAEALGFDRVVLVPAARPPHKPSAELADAEHRLAMTRLAVAGHPRFEVSDLELRRSGLSYTVDTLAALAPRGRLSLLIGSETFLDLLSWKDPVGIVGRARLVVVPRSGLGFDPAGAPARAILDQLGLERFVPVPMDGAPLAAAPRTPLLAEVASLPISGSDLRRRARAGRSLAFRLPEAVADYIRSHRLYRVED